MHHMCWQAALLLQTASTGTNQITLNHQIISKVDTKLVGSLQGVKVSKFGDWTIVYQNFGAPNERVVY